MKHVNPARKPERDDVNTARVGPAVALMWVVLAIGYGVVTWMYGLTRLIAAPDLSRLRWPELVSIVLFPLGYASIALAALVCAVAALLRLRCYGEYRMDKLWLLGALLGTWSFPLPMLMPREMWPSISSFGLFTWFGITQLIGFLTLCVLVGLICLPFTREVRGSG